MSPLTEVIGQEGRWWTKRPTGAVRRAVLEVADGDGASVSDDASEYGPTPGGGPPHALSSGMRKRASIVRTLVYDSSVVLMDEPFGPLDAQTRVILQAELLKLWERNKPTVLFVTHDLVEAIALSDRIIVFTSSPGTIKTEYAVDLPRPRDPFRIHESPGFNELHDALWQDIREEIARSRSGKDEG